MVVKCLWEWAIEVLKMGRYFQRRTSGKIIVALGWNVKAIFQRGVPLARRPSDQNQKGGPGVSGPPLSMKGMIAAIPHRSTAMRAWMETQKV